MSSRRNNRYRFTDADRQKAFINAVASCMDSAEKLAWLYRKVKKSCHHYRKGK